MRPLCEDKMSKAADVVAAVSDFNKSELKHVEPEVKNPLPTADGKGLVFFINL